MAIGPGGVVLVDDGLRGIDPGGVVLVDDGLEAKLALPRHLDRPHMIIAGW